MKHVKTTESERTFTLELTERELGTIIAAYGRTSHERRKEGAKSDGVKSIETHAKSHELYRALRRVYGLKEDYE